MKKSLFVTAVFFLFQMSLSAQTIIKLDGVQSMSISGKGPGQDAVKNQYLNTSSLGIIENIGKNKFSIRIQRDSKIIKEIPIKPKETKKVVLPKGCELYFDSKSKSIAKVKFEKAPVY